MFNWNSFGYPFQASILSIPEPGPEIKRKQSNERSEIHYLRWLHLYCHAALLSEYHSSYALHPFDPVSVFLFIRNAIWKIGKKKFSPSLSVVISLFLSISLSNNLPIYRLVRKHTWEKESNALFLSRTSDSIGGFVRPSVGWLVGRSVGPSRSSWKVGKRAFLPLPTRPQLMAVHPALFFLSRFC